MAKGNDSEKNINISIDKTLWKKVGVISAETDKNKKEIVHLALENYLNGLQS